METMLKFSRLSQLTSNPDVILDALKLSTTGLMEICSNPPKIRRSKDKPIPEDTPERALEIKNRTVYCKGFPREGTNIDRILDFFKDHPTVENAKVL